MHGRTMLCLGLVLLIVSSTPIRAQHQPGYRVGGRHPHGGSTVSGAAGGYPGYGLPLFAVAGPGGISFYAPGFLVMSPGGWIAPAGSMIPPPVPLRGPLLPAPPGDLGARWPERVEHKPPPAPADPVRGGQLMTVGDRLFRAGNLKKAEERYQQAAQKVPNQAAPHLRLAQIALVRGNYHAAANRLREAETAQPGWLATAPDIQSIYGEPAEFARQIARLESYVQAHPGDRDAWLVLGAQWFLTGRTARAADVFLRLDDPRRRPDIALTAFLDASDRARPRAGAGANSDR